MSNTSATGGYLVPASSSGFPDGLTLTQFIQSMLVGISGIDGKLVRPRWQVAPPTQPSLETNWIAFAVKIVGQDANAYVSLNSDGSSTLQRHEKLEIPCAFYGPDAIEIQGLVRDGFQIQQNLEAMRAANMGFAYCDDGQHIPDLVNERWVDRVEMSVFLRRQVQRVYPVLAIQSAKGSIKTILQNQLYTLGWQVQEGE